MNKIEIMEKLQQAENLSINYIGWLEHCLQNIEEFGEKPTFEDIGKTWDNLPLIKTLETKYVRNLYTGNDEMPSIRTNFKDVVIEIDKDNNMLQMNCTYSQYMNYQSPMPYAMYILG